MRKVRMWVGRLAAIALLVVSHIGCGGSSEHISAQFIVGGDAEHGRQRLRDYGCISCHTISSVTGADGLVGPSLDRIGSRTYIGGVLHNTPANMIRWIQNPPEVDPLTAMPQLGVTESDARDIAAFLYTLR